MIRGVMVRLVHSFAALAACWSAWCMPPTTAYGQTGVYTMNADGSDVKRIYHENNIRCGSPSWTHDGKKIAFDGGPNGFQQSHIFVLTLGEERPADIGAGNTPSFSPDDQQIAFFLPGWSKGVTKPGVWVMNADGKNREWISDGERPRWSRDGDKLVFVGKLDGFASVYVYDTVSLERTRIVDRGYDAIIGADFSSDDSRIVFIGFKGGDVFSDKGEVAVVEAKPGAVPQSVCRGRVGWHPDWSPEGNKLLFRINNGSGLQQLHVLDLDGGGLATPLPKFCSDAVWSHDGKQIVYTGDRGG